MGRRILYIPERIGFTPIKYGALYNWYAATDVRNIANVGWEVPEKTDFETLYTYLGGQTTCGGLLKEAGLTHWDNPNQGATNVTLFNGRGAGQRATITGAFSNLKATLPMWSITESTTPSYYYEYELKAINIILAKAERLAVWGHAIRLIKTTTSLSHGEEGTYTGNDGKVYRTICIGTQEWLADNLFETKFRNGDLISVVTDNVAWAALTTGAMCYYNNDISNA